MDLGLRDHSYIVTGGTGGLGRAVAEVLVAEGASVLVCSRSAEKVAEAVAALGPRADGIVADLTDPGTPGRLIATARERFGRLDGLFVSHGGPPAGAAGELDDEALDRSIEVALKAPIRVVRDVAAALDEGGSIVVLTSASSVEPIGALAGSNVTRPGTWAFAKTLADELAPRGIRVNALLPGRFATDRLTELHTGLAERTGRTFDEVRADVAASIPLRRIGDPAELGRVGAFLLSPAASYVTGTAWAVDGGAIRGL